MSNGHIEELTDLNALALKEFRLIISQNMELDPKWKQALLKITEKGIPKDLNALIPLIKDDINDKA